MKLKLKVFDCLCATETFEINGIQANSSDFGENNDEDSENADDYGCGNMQFTTKPSTQEVLDKYKISVDEYNKIAEQLSEKMSFGCCGWCI